MTSDEEQRAKEVWREVWRELHERGISAEDVAAGITRQAQAGETKRRRNREKLIQAADAKMREDGWDATIEDICKDAGLSTATFYSYFPSRNTLCLAAFLELVIAPLEALGIGDRPFDESVEALLKQCEGRSALVRAALAGRLENAQDSYVLYHQDPFIEDIAALLASHWGPEGFKRYTGREAGHGKPQWHKAIAEMSVLFILDSVATNHHPNGLGEIYELMKTTLPAE